MQKVLNIKPRSLLQVWIFPKKVDTVKRKVSPSAFHTQKDIDTPTQNVFFVGCRRLRYTQRWNEKYPNVPHIVIDTPPSSFSHNQLFDVSINLFWLYFLLPAYTESSSIAIITTKSTKDTKRECQNVLSFLRDLRALRGETIYDQISWNFPDNREKDFAMQEALTLHAPKRTYTVFQVAASESAGHGRLKCLTPACHLSWLY